tara:strand:- start:1180 stop:1611 length:432 start_codon:yes stop_codon:yes gene_type:complete
MRKKKQKYEKLVIEAIKQEHKDFCAVIALSVIADIGFNRSAKLMTPARKNKKSGSYPSIYISIYQKTLKVRNKKLENINIFKHEMKTGKRFTTKKFAQKFDKGTYLLHTARHTLVIRDGIIEDWNKDRPRGQFVKEAYKVVNL